MGFRRFPAVVLLIIAASACAAVDAVAQNAPSEACPRPSVGAAVPEPKDLRSENGVLRVDLTYRSSLEPNGSRRYCYSYRGGGEAPTLRLKPGDLLILRLKNDVNLPSSAKYKMFAMRSMPGGCAGAQMNAAATNIHFHGLDVPPVCHEDDVLNTLIEPGGRPFEYRFRIPADEPPGLYWYHPHVHGLTKTQVLGGASGALIVEGIERANKLLAGLPERVFVIRDEDLEHPDAEPIQSGNVPPPIVLRDAEGDILNTGTGGGKPAKDLSINFVPASFPDYVPGVIRVKSGERQFWRVLNSCAITYLDLQLLVNNVPQPLGVVALDGVPINENARVDNRIIWQSHVLLPPAGRAEFIVRGLPAGQTASFVTRTVDTGPAGENDPTRPLATVVVSPDALEPRAKLTDSPAPPGTPEMVWLGDVTPARTRKLYFSEKPRNPNDPNSPTDFYITVDGQEPKLFDPKSNVPDIVVQQGDVEDWMIENRTQELHAFHIHQIHFMLTEFNGVPLDEPFLRDTINVSYWDGKSRAYPSVKLRMDFRNPNVVGTFVYHCHLLEHEDGGMMGLIRVEPKGGRRSARLQRVPTGRPLCGSPVLTVSGATHRSNAERYNFTKAVANGPQEIAKDKIQANGSF
ncbi:MAG TPA: multicopper oxidase domain-containing protein [Candidatus Acidoferrales bacterium]|nr:multicopper oxidase domain-containing protein [Candidatus Acidoferrales bacterium]